MPATPPDARPIRLETERFLLRTLYAEDATQPYADWLADPEVMTPLNRPPITRLSLEQLAGTIRASDGIRSFQIGIFELASGRHIGNYSIDIDHANSLAWFNVLIGDKAFWGEKVVLETRAALLDHFFDERGVEKALGKAWTRNFPAVFNYKAQGWRLEGVFKSHLKSRTDDSRRDVCQFALLKDEWLAIRNGTTS
jgi:RimJ/RimL family protein N-acetyltransferase